MGHRVSNTRYDGIFCPVSVSMGFAFWENLSYVVRHSLSTGYTGTIVFLLFILSLFL